MDGDQEMVWTRVFPDEWYPVPSLRTTQDPTKNRWDSFPWALLPQSAIKEWEQAQEAFRQAAEKIENIYEQAQKANPPRP